MGKTKVDSAEFAWNARKQHLGLSYFMFRVGCACTYPQEFPIPTHLSWLRYIEANEDPQDPAMAFFLKPFKDG